MATTRKPTAGPPTPVPDLWTRYRVRWEFLHWICGSVPANPNLIKVWLASRMPTVKPAGALSLQELHEEVVASLERGEGEAPQDYSMLVFQRHDGILSMRHGTVRAHIKDCARVLSRQFYPKIQGESAFSSRVLGGLYPDLIPHWLPLRRPDGTPVREADGYHDKAVHVWVPGRGQISALKRFEYVENAVLEFDLLALGQSIPESDLHLIFAYGGVHGYAGERSDGEGRYRYTLTRIDAGGLAVPAAGDRAPATHG